jgi:hypothetical protein
LKKGRGFPWNRAQTAAVLKQAEDGVRRSWTWSDNSKVAGGLLEIGETLRQYVTTVLHSSASAGDDRDFVLQRMAVLSIYVSDLCVRREGFDFRVVCAPHKTKQG